jgi:hypothetical protein
MKTTSNSFDIIQSGGKFVVTKNGERINLPRTTGAPIVTEFDTKQDAEKYLAILKTLSSQSQYRERK